MKLAIIGLGLIGGSIALAAKKNKACTSISAFDLNRNSLEKAFARGIIDNCCFDIETVISDANLIIIAVPVEHFAAILEVIAPQLKSAQVITDVGSTKAQIVQDAQKILQKKFSQFVPGHPLSGSEKSGVDGAFEGLFLDQHTILTPTAKTNTIALETVKLFWQMLQAHVYIMTPEEHDKIVAYTSHLPHVISFAFVNSQTPDITKYRARSFDDLTRIAKSNPKIWHDIFLANKDNIINAIDKFGANLENLKKLISNEDSAGILKLIKQVNTNC